MQVKLLFCTFLGMMIWNTQGKQLMQDSMNIKLMYSAQKDKYEWPEKRDEIYYPVEHIACKTEPPATTRNGLHNCFVTTKQMALCYIKSADFIILYGRSLLDF